MKKITALLLIALLGLSMAACGAAEPAPAKEEAPQQAAEPEVVHVPYIRCPHCGKEIDVFVKPREEQQA